MTINTKRAYSWSAHNGGRDDPTKNRCSPNLVAITAHLKVRFPGGFGIQTLGCYGERDVIGGEVPSAHSHGAATDLRYASQYQRNPAEVAAWRFDRLRCLNEIIPFLIDYSAELRIGAIHDYVGCRIWHAGRTAHVSDAHTLWWRQQTPSATTGMGQEWAGWLHLETTLDGWGDGSSVTSRLPTTPPPPPPPPDPEPVPEPEPPAPPPKLERPLYVIIGNADNRDDPRRWLYDGFKCRLLLDEDDFNQVKIFGWLHPAFNTLQAPNWKPLAWIVALGG